MKLFSMMKKMGLIFIPLVLALALGWALRQNPPFFQIDENPISVQFNINHESLLTKIKPEIVAKLEDLKGQSIWKVSLAERKKDLESHPWIRSVSMQRQFPNRISTEIILDEVAFLYANKRNKMFPVLKSGKALDHYSLKWMPSAPILRNNNIFSNSSKLKKLIELYEELPTLGPFQSTNISEVDFNEINGLTVSLIEENVSVHFGQSNIQTKALQVLRVVDYLKSQKQKARVIDASFTKKVLVRLRKGS